MMVMRKQKCFLPKEAEKWVREKLRKKHGIPFDTNVPMQIGGKRWYFDLVSQDTKIIAEVKTCQKRYKDLTPAQKDTRFRRGYVFDCLKLEKARANKRYFFLFADNDLFNDFNKWCSGLINKKKVKFVFVGTWDKNPSIKI